MRHIVFILLLVQSICSAQTKYFNKAINLGGNWSSGMSVIADSNRYVISAIGGPGKQIVMMELDKWGEVNFIKKYGLNNHNFYAGRMGSLDKCENGFILGGSDDNLLNDTVSGLQLRFNHQLDTLWTRKFKHPNDDYLTLMYSKSLSDGGFILGGDISMPGYKQDIVLIKTDSGGNEIWRKQYGSGDSAMFIFNVVETIDKGFLIGGYQTIINNDLSSDAVVIKTDHNGIIEWKRLFGGRYSDGGAFVCTSSDNNLLVAYSDGIYQDTTPPYYEESFKKIRVVKLNINGGIIWNRIFGKCSQSIGFLSMMEINSSSIIGAGIYRDTINFENHGLLVKLNYWGDSIWWREFEYSNQINSLYDVDTTFDKGFIMSGQTFGDETNDLQCIWIVKVDSNGCEYPNCDPTVNISKNISKEEWPIVLSPNPANEKFDVTCSLLLDGDCKIEVFDLYGRKVRKIKVPGHEQSCEIITKGWREGMYIVKLHNSNGVLHTAKLIIGE